MLTFRRVTTPLLLALVTLASPAFAHLPELYGREYRRVDPGEDENTRQVSSKRTAPVEKGTEERFEQELRELEVTAGPYSQGLADPLTNLYQVQLLSGDPEEAAASLRRALHLVRVNEGLYSQSQIPLLRQLISIYRSQGAYEALGDVYSYYHRISRIGLDPPDEEALEVALEYLDWERQLYTSRVDGRQRDHLMRAYKANQTLLEAAADGPADIYVELAMSQMRNLYMILGDREISVAMGPHASTVTRAETQLAALQKIGYAKGRKLLSSCVDRMEDAPPDVRAKLYLELGDWQHWNGSHSRAYQQYATVFELMEEAGKQEQLGRWFDEPVELPNKSDLWSLIYEHNGEEPLTVEASYEVNRDGEARRVEATTGTEDGEWQASRIRAMLRDTHFRPRIGKDGPESAPRVTRHYRLIAIN